MYISPFHVPEQSLPHHIFTYCVRSLPLRVSPNEAAKCWTFGCHGTRPS